MTADKASGSRLARKLIGLCVVAIFAAGAWQGFLRYLYPVYRDHAWRHNVASAILLAGTHREAIARRLEAGATEHPAQAIAATGAVTGGYVTKDGVIVVTVLPDFPNLLVNASTTIVLRPWVDRLKGGVKWICGTTRDSARQAVPNTCIEVVDAPPGP